MWIIRYHTAGRRPPSGRTWFADFEGTWERVRLKGDAIAVSGLHVPDTHPNLHRVTEIVQSLESTSVVPDDRVERLSEINANLTARPGPAPVAATLAQLVAANPGAVAPPDVIEPLRAIALGNRWSPEELAGTGLGGEPGELGGRSPITGLTLVEHTLTSPPSAWPELRAENRPPWEATDWAKPGPGWVPPGWPERKVATATEPEPPAPVRDALLTDPPPADDAPPPPPEDKKGDDGDDEDPLASYPPAQYAEALAILLDLQKRKNGDVPHPNALNFFLRKAELASMNSKQIHAALAAHAASSTSN